VPTVAGGCNSLQDAPVPPRGVDNVQKYSENKVVSESGGDYSGGLKGLIDIWPSLSVHQKAQVTALVKGFHSIG
jgi:hypothetical protein